MYTGTTLYIKNCTMEVCKLYDKQFVEEHILKPHETMNHQSQY